LQSKSSSKNSYTLVSTPGHDADMYFGNASRLFTWFRVRGDVHERGRSRDAGAGEVLRLWDFWKGTKYNGILISTSAII